MRRCSCSVAALKYFYDAEAVRERKTEASIKRDRNPTPRGNTSSPGAKTPGRGPDDGRGCRNSPDTPPTSATSGPSPRTPTSAAHFATFPPALVEPCIKAGTSEHGVCGDCGAPCGAGAWSGRDGTIGKGWHDHTADSDRGQYTDGKGLNSDTYRARNYRLAPHLRVRYSTFEYRPRCSTPSPAPAPSGS